MRCRKEISSISSIGVVPPTLSMSVKQIIPDFLTLQVLHMTIRFLNVDEVPWPLFNSKEGRSCLVKVV